MVQTTDSEHFKEAPLPEVHVEVWKFSIVENF